MSNQAEFENAANQPVAMPESVRQSIEDAIEAHLDVAHHDAAEALIAMLDELDGDDCLEDDGTAEREPEQIGDDSMGPHYG